MATRGRPKLRLTARRRDVLSAYADAAASGGDIRLAEIARRCGLYDYRDARRIVGDLKAMGAI